MSVREWNGVSYDRISAPQERWGREVLGRLELSGEEVVLDAGCGSGRVTQLLAQRLPRGRVIAVDASPSMAQAARARLPPEVDVRVIDLLQLQLAEPVDAILSTATFHWIADHDRLFARLHASLRPGGRLVAQCGGEGNVERTRLAALAVGEQEPFAEHLHGWAGPWNFASARDTETRLYEAGFREARCWLVPDAAEPAEPWEFLRTVSLGAHLARLPQELRDPFVSAVHKRLGDPFTVDYVRLNIDAVA